MTSLGGRGGDEPRGALASQLDAIVGDVPGTYAGTTAFLIGLSGHHAGKLFRIKEGESFIGRSSKALVTLDEKAVSQRHARLVFHGGQCVITDLGSTNGTFVNDVRLSDPLELHAGDVIRCGKAALGYLTDASDQEQHTRALARVSLVGIAPPGGALARAPAYSPSLAVGAGEGGSSLDAALDKLALLWGIVRVYWKAVLLAGLTFALLGAASLVAKPPLATAEFLIFLRHQGNDVQPQGPYAAQGAEYFRFPVENFANPDLVRETMRNMKLAADSPGAVIATAKSLSLSPVDQGVYRGSFFSGDANFAERFLAAHLHNYLESEITKSIQVLGSEVKLLRKQYEDNERSLLDTENKLKEFKQEHMAGLPENATRQLESRASLESRALELRASLERYTQELAHSKKQYDSGDKYVADKVDRSQSYATALATARQNLAIARSRGLKDDHPEVQKLLREEKQLSALEQSAVSSAVTDTDRRANREQAALADRVGQLGVLASSTKTELDLIQGRLSELNKIASTMPQVEATFSELSRNLSASQNLHQHLYEQLKAKELKLEFDRASVVGRYELLEAPHADPVKPVKTASKRAGVGFAVGLVLGCVGVALHWIITYARQRRSVA